MMFSLADLTSEDIKTITDEQVEEYRRAYLNEHALLEQFPLLKKVIKLDRRPKASAPAVFIKRYLAVEALSSEKKL